MNKFSLLGIISTALLVTANVHATATLSPRLLAFSSVLLLVQFPMLIF